MAINAPHDLIEDYKKKKFTIDFKEVSLKSNCDKHASFNGPGYIKQTENGKLFYKLYSKKSPTIFEFFQRIQEQKRGKLIPKNQVYKLTGIDIDDREWIVEQTTTKFQSTREYAILSDKINHLSLLTKIKTNSPFNFKQRYHIPRSIDFPSNSTSLYEHYLDKKNIKKDYKRDAAKFEADDFALTLLQESEWTIIEILYRGKKPKHLIGDRLTGALHFLLGEPIDWVIFEESTKEEYSIEFRPFQKKYNIHKHLVPYDMASQEPSIAWDIFDKYFHKSIEYHDHKFFITEIISKCIYAAEGSIDAYSLTVSLAIEEILNVGFKNLNLKKRYKDSELSLLFETLDELKIDQNLKNRLNGYYKYLNTPDATDILRFLKNEGFISTEEFKNWKKIRNHFAHPRGNNLDLQNLIDRNYSNLTLLYKLIFLIIGYTGKHINYGKEGWPMTNFSKSLSHL